MLDLESTIKHYEQIAKNQIECADRIDELHCDSTTTRYMAEHHRQLAEWLRKLQRYEFEISECKAILDRPAPDVTENDRKRAMYVLQTFPDVGGEEE